MFDAIRPLLDSGLINEDVSRDLNEAWESKLTEAREQLRAELREEFARRYDHDKQVMVEALDKMVTEGLASEIQRVRAEKQSLREDRKRFAKSVKESSNKIDNFVAAKLAEEISDLRKDRRLHNKAIDKMESFVARALAEEISEFQQDKRDLVETKVRLMREAREKLGELKAKFISESARKTSRLVTSHLKAELTQLKEDVEVARKNSFGRRIFEAYAAEFGATYLNENAEVRKLSKQLEQANRKLSESANAAKRAQRLVESKEREIRIIKESNQRAATLEELLSPLNDEKREVMQNLLESVQTSRLKSAYEKYLPAVLNNAQPKGRQVLGESIREVTGDKTVKAADIDHSNVIEIKRLAGL